MDADRPWDEASVRRLVGSVATVDIRLFSRFPDVDRDDLVQIGLTAAAAAKVRNFRADGGSTWENFVCGVAHRRNLDELRTRVRRRAREQRVAMGRPEAIPAAVIHFAEFDKDIPLPEWLRGVYVAARRVYTSARWRRGRKYYNIAQLIALATLKYRMGKTVSFESLRDMLLEDKALRLACRLRHVPSRWAIQRAMIHLAEFHRTTIDPVMGVPDPLLQGRGDVAPENSDPSVCGE